MISTCNKIINKETKNLAHKTQIFLCINHWKKKKPRWKTNTHMILLWSNQGSFNMDNGPLREIQLQTNMA
jgi:hypothetical protein